MPDLYATILLCGDAMAQLITNLDDFPASLHSAALAVGNFDGVHRGHAKLIAQLVDLARAQGSPAVVLTFDPPPQAILVPSRPLSAPLTPIPRRAELLCQLGVDALIAYPTDIALLRLSAVDFFEQIVVGRLHASAMVEGPNFRFGRDRSGGTDLLRQLCHDQNMRFEVAQATEDASGMISSTRIRSLLSAGDVATANAMLTQAYEIRGDVTEGAKRGRELGFPTANLKNIQSFIPAHGVYSGAVTLEGSDYVAAINIGPNPTFDEQRDKVEVHIVGWSDSLYGANLRCRLSHRIRDIRKFESVEELRQQISQDIATCQTRHLAARDPQSS